MIVEGIGRTRASLGWVGFAFYVEENLDTIRPIEIDGGDGCVEPTAGDDRQRRVSDRPRPVHLRQHGRAAEENPARGAFVDYYLSDDGLGNGHRGPDVTSSLPDDRSHGDPRTPGQAGDMTPGDPAGAWLDR